LGLIVWILGPENGTHFAPRFRAPKWASQVGFPLLSYQNLQGSPISMPGIWAQNGSHFLAPGNKTKRTQLDSKKLS
jgi:hypothetical protein